MYPRKLVRITLAVAGYVILTFGALDGLIHWWTLTFSPVPEGIALSLWCLSTVGYVWFARRTFQ